MPQLTWLITGCSSSLGELFVRSILARGDRAIATTRNNGTERLVPLKEAGAAVLDLDVTAPQAEIDSKIAEALGIYGGVDVLVNNAGYVEVGMVEEVSHERYLRQFNTNLFGVINTTRAILPHFRAKKSGVIVFIGSVNGIEGVVGAGAYCGTKFALEGVADSLRHETSSFGIRSVLFQLGFFRTEIMTAARLQTDPAASSAIPDYGPINKLFAGFVDQMNGNQPGDPQKAVNIMIDVVKGEGVAEGKAMPERLPLGKDCLGKIREKYTGYLEVCREWEGVISSTDLEEGERTDVRTDVKGA